MKRKNRQISTAIISMLLVLSLTLCITTASTRSLDIWAATDYTDDFPLNLNPVVDDDSIQYIQDAQMESQEKLDIDALKVDVSISSKEEQEILRNGYHLTIQKDANIILEGEYSKEDKLTLEEIARGEMYDIYIYIEQENIITEYIGTFYYDVDFGVDGEEVCIDLDFTKKETSKISSRAVTSQTESESNDTIATADAMICGQSVTGKLSSKSDIDYFKFSNPYYKNTKISFLFKVNTATDATFVFQIYFAPAGGTTQTLKKTVSVASGVPTYVNLPITQANGMYYVRVSTTWTGALTDGNYLFNANFSQAKSWYSQKQGYTGTGASTVHYWNTEKLDKLYFPSYSSYVFIDNNASTSTDIMAKGCFDASIAMVLRNLNKTRVCHDFRTATSGTQMADPYTVMLANINKYGNEITYNSSTGKYSMANVSANPVHISTASSLCSKFGATFASKDLRTDANGNPLTAAQKEALIAQKLSQINSGGLIISLDDGQHYVVVTGYTSGSTALADRLTICDAGANIVGKGDNVKFSQSHSASRNISASGSKGITYMYWIT